MRDHQEIRNFGLRMATVLILLCFTVKLVRAQEYPRWELFGGFSYAHVNLGAQSTTFLPTGQNYYGMNLNGSFNPRSYLRIVLCDFSVQMGSTTTKLTPEHADLRTSQVLFGPEFIRRSEKVAPFAHALIGITNTRLVSSLGGVDIVPDVARRTNLAFGVGGGFDIHWTRLLAIRLVQADYIPTRLAGSWENQFRVSSGIVFTFGYQGKGTPRH